MAEPATLQFCFGLIGRKLSHSFSARYFSEKFNALGLDARYDLFELEKIEELPDLLKKPNLVGLNVTIPYKQAVMPLLNSLHESAARVGAVNTIARTTDGWRGYNTDMPAFRQSLLNFCQEEGRPLPTLALVLGTGGASAAVAVALGDLGIQYRTVSRSARAGNAFGYRDLTDRLIVETGLVVNTTPLGMHPDIGLKPDLPYEQFNSSTLAFDLVYNPEETAFMQAMRAQGSPVRNGLEMLHLQAEGAWEVWKQQIP